MASEYGVRVVEASMVIDGNNIIITILDSPNWDLIVLDLLLGILLTEMT